MIMPPSCMDTRRNLEVKRIAKAKRQVREKFPKLIEGTPGWNRAVQNRINRLPLE